MLIIGILAAAVSSGGEYIQDTRLANARALTNSSPVHSTKGLAVWYDAVSEASFDESEAGDGATITTWFDINSQRTRKRDAEVSSISPLYASGVINNLPAVRFNGDGLDVDWSGVNGSNTIFIVAQSDSNLGAGNQVFSNTGFATLSYNQDNSDPYQLRPVCGSGGGTNPINIDESLINTPNILTLTCRKAGLNVKQQSTINGTSYSLSNSSGNIYNYSNDGSLGDGFNGYIAEVIIFNRYLREKERTAIEEYLAQKWKIDIGS